MTEEIFTSVQVKTDISDFQIKGLLCDAFEGGVSNWCRIDDYRYAPGITAKDFDNGGKFNPSNNYFHPCEIVPLIPGCALLLSCEDDGSHRKEWESNDEDDAELCQLILDSEKIKRGLQIFAEVFPKHFSDFLKENDDADTGDTFLQCCLYPDDVLKNRTQIFG